MNFRIVGGPHDGQSVAADMVAKDRIAKVVVQDPPLEVTRDYNNLSMVGGSVTYVTYTVRIFRANFRRRAEDRRAEWDEVRLLVLESMTDIQALEHVLANWGPR